MFTWTTLMIPLCVFSLTCRLNLVNKTWNCIKSEIRLNPGVAAWLCFSAGKRENIHCTLCVQLCSVNCSIFCQILCTETFSTIHQQISLNSAVHRNLFCEHLTWGICLAQEHSNKQLSMTDSCNNVRNVTPHIVCFSLSPH